VERMWVTVDLEIAGPRIMNASTHVCVKFIVNLYSIFSVLDWPVTSSYNTCKNTGQSVIK
jgi:hypothetical protein